MNILHSSKEDSWKTPKYIMDLVHAVMPVIDLDPASDPEANKLIGAKTIITREQDGLITDWAPGSVFINPPGGKKGNQSLTSAFWIKLMKQRQAGNLKEAIFLAFSVEALQTTQNKGFPSLGDFTVCIPSKRIKFDHPSEVKKAPSHSSAIVYVHGTEDNQSVFTHCFKDLGVVLTDKERDSL